MGYSPWGCKESDTTEGLSMRVRTCTHTHIRTHTGETGKQATTRERWQGLLEQMLRSLKLVLALPQISCVTTRHSRPLSLRM